MLHIYIVLVRKNDASSSSSNEQIHCCSMQ